MGLPIVFAGVASAGVVALAGTVTAYVLVGLGFSFVSYVGATILVEAVELLLAQALSEIDSAALDILALARVDDAFAIQLHFALMRVAIAGLRKLRIMR